VPSTPPPGPDYATVLGSAATWHGHDTAHPGIVSFDHREGHPRSGQVFGRPSEQLHVESFRRVDVGGHEFTLTESPMALKNVSPDPLLWMACVVMSQVATLGRLHI
jgi:hypothetical protein